MSVDIDDDRNSSEASHTGGTDQTRSTALDPLRESFSLQIALVGVLAVAVAYVVNTGVWPAMIAVWGTAFVLIGVGTHLFVRLSQRGTRG